jgi:hypothetical protein
LNVDVQLSSIHIFSTLSSRLFIPTNSVVPTGADHRTAMICGMEEPCVSNWLANIDGIAATHLGTGALTRPAEQSSAKFSNYDDALSSHARPDGRGRPPLRVHCQCPSPIPTLNCHPHLNCHPERSG